MKKTLEIINELVKVNFIESYAIGDAIAELRWVDPFFTRDLDLLNYKDNRVMTLKEFFEEEQKARIEMAKFTFEEKIKILITLQKIARSWVGKKDVIVWQTPIKDNRKGL